MKRTFTLYSLLCCLLLWQFSATAGTNPEHTTGISLNCPGNITMQATPGASGATVTWNNPTATTACTTTETNCGALSNSVSGFVYMGQYNGSKYYCTSSNNYTWHEARTLIYNRGGFMATISSSGENNFIRNNMIASYAWLGYNDSASEGYFVWESGSNASYTNWVSGEPNNYNNSDYTVIVRNDGKWKDRQGHDDYEGIMEKRCPVTNVPGTVSISRTAGPARGSFFPVGTTTVSYIATDNCGNAKTCSFTVIVNAAAP